MNTHFIKIANFVLVLWLMAALLIACQPIRAETARAQAALPQEEHFKQVVMAKEAAYANNDLDGFLAFFADDTVSMPPDGIPTKGKTQLAADMKAFFDTYEVDSQVKLVDVALYGDFATRTLQTWDTLTPKAGGDPIHASGSCIAGWKKINGEWKIVWEIWNSEPLPSYQALGKAFGPRLAIFPDQIADRQALAEYQAALASGYIEPTITK